jgi:hypothetical protein
MLNRALTLAEAKLIIGSIGFPSKMPSSSYGLPARACIVGAALAKVSGSICSDCYATRTFYQIPKTQKGLERRLAAISDPRWVDAMVKVLRHLHSGPIRVDLGQVGVRLQVSTGNRAARWRWNEPGYHRWHDSGDLQSVEHLEKIIEVCRRTPRIKHWLPTRELAMLRACKAPMPPNLTIRVSAALIDGPAPTGWPGSTVHTVAPPEGAFECGAPQQGNYCGSCRNCWDKSIPLISYHAH